MDSEGLGINNVPNWRNTKVLIFFFLFGGIICEKFRNFFLSSKKELGFCGFQRKWCVTLSFPSSPIASLAQPLENFTWYLYALPKRTLFKKEKRNINWNILNVTFSTETASDHVWSFFSCILKFFWKDP